MPLTVARHAVIDEALARLRDRTTEPEEFRRVAKRVALILAAEATRDLVTREGEVATPLETTRVMRLATRVVAVPILRAGLGMVEGIAQLVPSARVGHIGLYREHDTLKPVDYYFKIPAAEVERDFFVLDPMLATGGSAVAAVGALREAGARRIRFLCIVSAPEGVTRMLQAHPDVHIYTASLDRQLNEQGYILPGLGDAGDRLFGTRSKE